MNQELIVSILLGIGLSASSGFRVFVPLFIASLAAKWNFLSFGEGFEWLKSYPAMICFGVASIVEIASYYIPIVDNFLDTLATPLAVLAGALLSISILPIDNEMSKWVLGIIIGGGSAGIVQGGTVATRLLSTKASLSTANPVLSTTENIGAIFSPILAIAFPIFIGILFIAIFYIALKKLNKWKTVNRS